MKKRYPFIRAVMIVVYAFIFLPIFIVALMSFNASQYGTFPFVFSTKWYVRLFTGASLGGATWLSIWFSLLVTLTMAVVGVMTSLGLKRSNAKFAKVFSALLNMGVIIPWLVLGVALLMIFNFIGLGRSYLGMYLGNSICVLPYVVLLVYPALCELNDNLEFAARAMGASPLRAFFTVVLPGIFPAVAAGGLMAFMVCFNNFVIQYYLAPFGVRTLPLEIYNMVRVGYKPDINALATIMVLFSTALVYLVNKLGYGSKRSLL